MFRLFTPFRTFNAFRVPNLASSETPEPDTDNLLLESGSALLLESGALILLESA